MPLYGRGFEQTAGIRQPYNGVSGLFVLLCQYLEPKLSTLRSAPGHGGQGMSKLSFNALRSVFTFISVFMITKFSRSLEPL